MDTKIISLLGMLDGTLEMGTEESIPKVKCDVCGNLIAKVDGDDSREIICNTCYFSMDENI